MMDKKNELKKYKRLIEYFYFQNDFKYKFQPEKLHKYICSIDQNKQYRVKRFGKVKHLNNHILKKSGNKSKLSDVDFDETEVYLKINLLTKKGLWSRLALPKVLEPCVIKSHWDYLLDEIKWLSIDFIQQMKWKKYIAKIISEEAIHYVNAKQYIIDLENKLNQNENRKRCLIVSNMVKDYWKEQNDPYSLSEVQELRKILTEDVLDHSGLWFSENLANNFDDGESTCSFCSNSLNDDTLESEVKWLNEDSFAYENENNEITELMTLSETPIENLVTFDYLLNRELSFSSEDNDTSSSSSTKMDELLNYYVNSYSGRNSQIFLNLKEILNYKNKIDFIQKKMYTKIEYQMKEMSALLSEMILNKLIFGLYLPLSQDFERNILINSISNNCLIVSSIFNWDEWKKFKSSNIEIIYMDDHVSKINEGQKSTVYFLSYTMFITNPDLFLSFTWDLVIFEQFDEILSCGSLISLKNIKAKSKIFLMNTRIKKLNYSKLKLFFEFLFTENDYFILKDILELNKESKDNSYKQLLQIAFYHGISFEVSSKFKDNQHFIMCVETKFQKTLRFHIMNKLKKSLESNNLMEIVEIIAHDLNLSQSAVMFDNNTDSDDAIIYKDLLNEYVPMETFLKYSPVNLKLNYKPFQKFSVNTRIEIPKYLLFMDNYIIENVMNNSDLQDVSTCFEANTEDTNIPFLDEEDLIKISLEFNLNEKNFKHLESFCSTEIPYQFRNEKFHKICGKIREDLNIQYSMIPKIDVLKSLENFQQTSDGLPDFIKFIDRDVDRILNEDNILLYSGKLSSLEIILSDIYESTTLERVIILSHKFELLCLVNDLLYSKFYSKFRRFSLQLINPKDFDSQIELIGKFNKSTISFKKAVILVHSRINIDILCNIKPLNSAVIVLDNHWQIDSNKISEILIRKWTYNTFNIGRNNKFEVYRLCSFESLEQYFLKNDLSFLYKNCYFEKHELKPINSLVCQEAVLKEFVEKLDAPLKEFIICGFPINDFKSNFKMYDSFQKTSKSSIADVLQSFENPIDMQFLYLYVSKQSLINNEIQNMCLVSKQCNFKNSPNIDFERTINLKNDADRFIQWEQIRHIRENYYKNVKEFNFEHECFYRCNDLNLQNFSIWGPPVITNTKYFPKEISDMYLNNSLIENYSSNVLIPTKTFSFKKNKQILKTNITCKNKIEPLIRPDSEKLKRRKISDFSDEITQKLSTHKKRKTNHCFIKSDITNFYEIENQNTSIIKTPDESKEDISVSRNKDDIVKKHGMVPSDSELNITEPICSSINQCNSTENAKCNMLSLSSGSSKLNIPKPHYLLEANKMLRLKRQQLTSTNLGNLKANQNSTFSNTLSQSKQNKNVLHNMEFVQSNIVENESEYHEDWNLHEEIVLLQHINKFQQTQHSIDKSNKSSPNFQLVEFYLYYYHINSLFRNSRNCRFQYDKIQDNFAKYNSQTSFKAKSQIVPSSNSSDFRTLVESKNITPNKKLKVKIKSANNPNAQSQGTMNKLKVMFNISNESRLGLMKSDLFFKNITSSNLKSTNSILKMIDDVLSKSRSPPPNHSQTIKKNATHSNALEENNIFPDKIFTPAMLIQRRDEILKESEIIANRHQSINQISQNSRQSNFYEQNSMPKRIPSMNQQLYTVSQSQTNISNRPRCQLPVTRQLTGTNLQPINSHNPNSNIQFNINTTNSTASLVMCQPTNSNMQNRNVQQSFQYPNRAASQNQRKLIQRYLPCGPGLRQSPIVNRPMSAPFVRSINPATINSQTNISNQAGPSNSIITVYPNNEPTNMVIMNNQRQQTDPRNVANTLNNNQINMRPNSRGNTNNPSTPNRNNQAKMIYRNNLQNRYQE